MRLAVICLALLASLAACSSGGGGSNTLPELPPRKDPLAQLEVVPKRPDIPPPKVGRGEEFTAEQRKFMTESFRVFMWEASPDTDGKTRESDRGEEVRSWSDLREDWIELGPRAIRVLVENLFVYLLAAQTRALPVEARRAQAELVDLGTASVPYLAATLRLEKFTDRQGNEQDVDEVTRRTAAETLALIGPRAAPDMVRLLPVAPAASRRVVAKALVDLPGPPATGALLELLDDESFVVAAEAASALWTHPGRNVTDRLVAVFADRSRDRLVGEKAGTALVKRRDAAATPALVRAMEAALAEDDLPMLRACGRILRRTTGLALRDDPAAWRDALEEGGGR